MCTNMHKVLMELCPELSTPCPAANQAAVIQCKLRYLSSGSSKQIKKGAKTKAKGNKATISKKKPAAEATTDAKAAASDIEVSLSDAEEQKQQVSTSSKGAGKLSVTNSSAR